MPCLLLLRVVIIIIIIILFSDDRRARRDVPAQGRVAAGGGGVEEPRGEPRAQEHRLPLRVLVRRQQVHLLVIEIISTAPPRPERDRKVKLKNQQS